MSEFTQRGLLAIGVAILLLVALAVLVRRAGRKRDQCWICDRDLTADEHDCCPECWERIA